MRNVFILLGMMVCLFGPTALFTIIGRKSMEELSKRPTGSGAVMIALITKLIIATAVIVGILVGLLKTFA